MLLVENMVEDYGNRLIGGTFIQHLEISFLWGKIVNAVVDGTYAGFIKFTFTRENGV